MCHTNVRVASRNYDDTLDVIRRRILLMYLFQFDYLNFSGQLLLVAVPIYIGKPGGSQMSMQLS